MISAFDEVILEIDGTQMWSAFHVDRAISFAKEYGYSGIAFHCCELMDKVVFPSKFFTKQEILDFNPVRNSITKNYQYYLRTVIEKCQNNGLTFYPEVKEINFETIHILLKHPDLIGLNGQLCASNPFWFEFEEEKVREFLELFPECAGIIVSCGSKESKVSISHNKCDCDRCRNYDSKEWYEQLIGAMYRPITSAGKKLIVRDFSYDKENQTALVDIVNAKFPGVFLAVKKTSHDYYPVAVDNLMIGMSKDQWVECDAWGQFFGLGAFPVSVVEDLHQRINRMITKGVKNMIVRTDWENMTQSSCFNSFNLLNAVAIGLICNNPSISNEEIYTRWCHEGLLSPMLADSYAQQKCSVTDPTEITKLTHLMQLGWKIMEKSSYARGSLININGHIHDRLDVMYYWSFLLHGRDQWEPELSSKLDPTIENINAVILEKEEALELIKEFNSIIDSLSNAYNQEITRYLEFLKKAYYLYVLGFALEIKTFLYIKRVDKYKDEEFIRKAIDSFDEYSPLAQRYRDLVVGYGYNHIMTYVLDGARLERFRDSAKQELERVVKGLQK